MPKGSAYPGSPEDLEAYRELVDRHLPHCPSCRDEVTEHLEVAGLLSVAWEPAPEGVWDRIAGSLEEAPPAMSFANVVPMTRPRRNLGYRVAAVVTNSGGPGILAADSMEPRGLELVELDADTVERLRSLFPPEASLRNPLDMIASATPRSYRDALSIVLTDPNVDSVVSIFVPPLGVRQEDVAEAIVSAQEGHDSKPVLAVLMGRDGLPEGRAELNSAGIPAYIFPESAARALAALVRYREFRERDTSIVERMGVDRGRAAGIVAAVVSAGRTMLDEMEALELLDAYGIPVAEARIATTPENAAEAAEEIGFPVVVKVVSPEVVHKSDVGGVVLDLENGEEVRAAAEAVFERMVKGAPDVGVDGVLVQRQVDGGHETIAGVTRDRVFGPLVMFGLGGIYVEALHDVVFRVAPIGKREAREMVEGIRGAPMLQGVRGQPPADLDAIVDVLCRLAQLAADIPEIEELDVNPLVALDTGVVAADARVRVG